jgi:hypothetical protein
VRKREAERHPWLGGVWEGQRSADSVKEKGGREKGVCGLVGRLDLLGWIGPLG